MARSYYFLNMNVFNYANPYDFEPRREEGDLVDNMDHEVEVLDIETEHVLSVSGCLPSWNVSVLKNYIYVWIC